MRVRKQDLEPYVEQLMGSKLIKKYVKAIYYHPVTRNVNLFAFFFVVVVKHNIKFTILTILRV